MSDAANQDACQAGTRSSSPISLRVQFRGHVQGVGFRASVHACCVEQQVAGWVRNERDGSVSASLVGTIDRVLLAIRSIHSIMRQNIEAFDAALEEIEGDPPLGFEIRRSSSWIR